MASASGSESSNTPRRIKRKVTDMVLSMPGRPPSWWRPESRSEGSTQIQRIVGMPVQAGRVRVLRARRSGNGDKYHGSNWKWDCFIFHFRNQITIFSIGSQNSCDTALSAMDCQSYCVEERPIFNYEGACSTASFGRASTFGAPFGYKTFQIVDDLSCRVALQGAGALCRTGSQRMLLARLSRWFPKGCCCPPWGAPVPQRMLLP